MPRVPTQPPTEPIEPTVPKQSKVLKAHRGPGPLAAAELVVLSVIGG